MKGFLLIVCICSSTLFSFGQVNGLLQQRIDSLYQVDQQVQTDMITAYQRGAGPKAMDSLDKVKEATFKQQTLLLKEIIAQHGLPTWSLVGKEASDNFITMVNHSFADIPFQEQIARLSKREIKRNNISAPAVALMIDKMRIYSGRQQLYGSQLDYDSAGQAIPKNLYKPKQVDKRRKKMKLGLLAVYLQKSTEMHQQMNKVNKL